MALLSKLPQLDLRIWARRESAARQAARVLRSRQPEGKIRATAQLGRAVRGAEVVVFCVPIGVMPELARQALPDLSAEVACTDVGSVKGPVVEELEAVLGGSFVGAHPMAGSERSGLAAAVPNLYDGATCILTPTERTHPEALRRVSLLWWQVGCHLLLATPDDHDAAVARVSHLPHLLSALLVNQVRAEAVGYEAFAGSGFRDASRLAGGPPGMWTEILQCNRQEILRALEEFQAQLDLARSALQTEEPTALCQLLRSACEHRHALYS